MRHVNLTQCLAGAAVGVALLIAFGVQPATLLAFAAALACPLMMVLMMRGMASHGHADGGRRDAGGD